MKTKEIESRFEEDNNIPPLKDPAEERQKALAGIDRAYKTGLNYYQENNLELAEKEFVKVLKSTLSKPKMQSLYVSIDDCKDKLLDAMHHLGKIYLVSEKYFNHHAKAAAIFQYCAGFAKKYDIALYDGADDTAKDFLHEAYSVEEKFLSTIGKGSEGASPKESLSKCHQEIKVYKDELENIRKVSEERLAAISGLTVEQIAERAKTVEEIYIESTKLFVNHGVDKDNNPGLIKIMLKRCFEQLGQPPEGSEYTVVGLGSLAGGKMTRWSDLEFKILINENKPEYKEYYRNLSKLLHIKVINLGETPLRSVGVEALNNFRTAKEEDDWFWDDVLTNGFSFDGPDWHACKSPLGSQGGYKAIKTVKKEDGTEEKILIDKPDFELIGTPKEMAKFQMEQELSNNNNARQESWFDSDKHLVQALRLGVLIDGSQSLLDDYRKEVREAVDEKIVQRRALELLQEDVGKFSLKLGDDEEGKLLDVKKDIFRIGDRIIDDLANYYRIVPEKGEAGLTAWQLIERMEEASILRSYCQMLMEWTYPIYRMRSSC